MNNIVTTNKPYSFSIFKQNLLALRDKYPFTNLRTIGYSVLGNNLYTIKLGNGPKEVFYSSSIHANEYITTIVLMKFIEEYCNAYVNRSNLFDTPIVDIFNATSIYIMPMVNPDGVNLVTNEFSKNSFSYQKAQKIASNFPNIPFPDGWKANINGVDLNLQFPAGWEEAKKIKYNQGFNEPAPRDFVGYGPLTEPESLAIYNFTLQHNFELVIALHTQGEEIYWNFQNYNPPNGFEIGKVFEKISGYTLTDVPYNSSFAGYKDWFIQNYNRPGYTIEAGSGVNPLPLSQVNEIYNALIGVLVIGASYLQDL